MISGVQPPFRFGKEERCGEVCSLTSRRRGPKAAGRALNGSPLRSGCRQLERALQRDRLAALLADLEREHGPIDAKILDEVRAEWPAPGVRTKRRRTA